MLLSFVIPVYNAAPYLRRCIESCARLAETARLDAEIIVVDDGSTDGSTDTIPRVKCPVKVISQQNQGVSVARNTGLAHATGTWIWFVDADDVIEKQQLTFDAKTAASADMVLTGFIWEEGGSTTSHGARQDEVPYNLWRCWFRRDEIRQHGVRFTPGRRYAEDQEFILRYLLAVKDCQTVTVNVPLYHYTMRPGSAMTRCGAKRRMLADTAKVLMNLAALSVKKGRMQEPWVWHEMKRLAKTLYVIARK